MPFTPTIDHEALQPLIADLDDARQEIEALDVTPMLARWLHRLTEARGAHMSTRIEGNPMTEEEVREAFRRPARRDDEAEIENSNYRDAVRFVQQVADDAGADIDGGLIRALHFLVLRDVDRHGTAGRYRTAQNAVTRGAERVYLPPPPTQVRGLMDDLVEWLRASRGSVHPLVLAAVAHVEFVSIHPLDDGNGRTARALTSYFLARGGWRLRDFVSVERVFGANPEAYYAALRALQDRRYPGQQVELTGWVEWFLQGIANAAGGAVGYLEGFLTGIDARARSLEETGLPPRLADALGYVFLFGGVTSGEYAETVGVSPATAVADLNRLTGTGLLRREGAGRATRYVHPDPAFVPFSHYSLLPDPP